MSTLRDRAGGASLIALAAIAVAHQIHPPFSLWYAGVAGWSAVALLWPRLGPKQRIPVVAMLVLGALGIAWSDARGQSGLVQTALSMNDVVVAMLVAVTFLQLVTLTDKDRSAPLPRGRPALAQTLFGVHLFGGVINLSTVMIVGERIAGEGRLAREQVTALTRAFGMAAFWSPFWAAMAIALTYAPGAQLPALLAVGIPLAAVGLGLAWLDLTSARAGGGAAFVGYPMSPGPLAIPLVLAIGVLATHALLPGWSLLIVVTVLAPLMSVGLLLWRHGVSATGPRLLGHVRTRLPAMAGEVSLFMSAAAFAAGVGGVLAAAGPGLPLQAFGAGAAVVMLMLIVGLAMAGLHPIISISVASTWIAPIGPDSNLLALTILAAWGIGTFVNPLSGLALALYGRFGVSGRDIVRWNLHFALKMLAVAAVMLVAYAALAL
ncbi:MAG: hypothetical protein ACOZDY_10485 [Pseudomonadota bacterium]